jgi:23S rRNA (uracil1939-C5)-methyltransferase
MLRMPSSEKGTMAGQNQNQIELVATGATSDGDALGREASGRVVFVPDALPGERVRVEIVSERPKSAIGDLVEVLEPSPHRVVPPCPLVPAGCGGCQWQHATAEEQRRMKVEIVVNAVVRAGIEPPGAPSTVELDPWAYRTTIRAAVIDGKAGFRRRQSHEVLRVPECLIAHPLLADLLAGGRFDGASEVLLRCGARTGERLAATVPVGLEITVPEGVRRDSFSEVAAGRRWRISAGSFFQARPDGADALARLVAGAAGPEGEPGTVLDLYSGVGLFSGVLAERGWAVTAVESSPAAVADARVNLHGLPVEVVRADVTGWEPPRASLVVADPSRNGLGRKGVEVVAASGARRLILISCDAISLGRDSALLLKQGYRLTAMTLVDMFPQTSHVEVVSTFDL